MIRSGQLLYEYSVLMLEVTDDFSILAQREDLAADEPHRVLLASVRLVVDHPT